MKKRLYIIRHATAEELGNSPMLRDFDRELTSFGIIEAARVAKKLVDASHNAELLISSEANRAKETAKIFAEQLKLDAELIQLDANLYAGGPKSYLAAVNGLAEEISAVMIFGHNPDVTFFVEYLTRGFDYGSMDKAAVAVIDFEGYAWAEVSGKLGTLVDYITPKNNEQES